MPIDIPIGSSSSDNTDVSDAFKPLTDALDVLSEILNSNSDSTKRNNFLLNQLNQIFNKQYRLFTSANNATATSNKAINNQTKNVNRQNDAAKSVTNSFENFSGIIDNISKLSGLLKLGTILSGLGTAATVVTSRFKVFGLSKPRSSREQAVSESLPQIPKLGAGESITIPSEAPEAAGESPETIVKKMLVPAFDQYTKNLIDSATTVKDQADMLRILNNVVKKNSALYPELNDEVKKATDSFLIFRQLKQTVENSEKAQEYANAEIISFGDELKKMIQKMDQSTDEFQFVSGNLADMLSHISAPTEELRQTFDTINSEMIDFIKNLSESSTATDSQKLFYMSLIQGVKRFKNLNDQLIQTGDALPNLKDQLKSTTASFSDIFYEFQQKLKQAEPAAQTTKPETASSKPSAKTTSPKIAPEKTGESDFVKITKMMAVNVAGGAVGGIAANLMGIFAPFESIMASVAGFAALQIALMDTAKEGYESLLDKMGLEKEDKEPIHAIGSQIEKIVRPINSLISSIPKLFSKAISGTGNVAKTGLKTVGKAGSFLGSSMEGSVFGKSLSSLASSGLTAAKSMFSFGNIMSGLVAANVVSFGLELKNVYKIAGGFGNIIGGVGKILGKIVNTVLTPFATAITRLSNAADRLFASFDFLGMGAKRKQSQAELAGELQSNFLPKIQEALINPLKGLPAIMKEMAGFVELVDPTTAAITNELLKSMAAIIGTILTPALQILNTGLNSILNDLVNSGIIESLQMALAGLAMTIIEAIGEMDFETLIDDLITGVSQIIDDITSAATAVSGIGKWFNWLGDTVKYIGDGLYNWIVAPFMSGINIMLAAMNDFAGWIGWFLGAGTKGDFSGLSKAISQAALPPSLAKALGVEAENKPRKQALNKRDRSKDQYLPAIMPTIGQTSFKGISDVGREIQQRSFTASYSLEKLQMSVFSKLDQVLANPQASALVQAFTNQKKPFINPRAAR